MGCLSDTLDGHLHVQARDAGIMIGLLVWVLAILATGAPAYMIWVYVRRAATLNQRIAMCDPTLLVDDGINVSRLMAVPHGTQYTENAQIVAAPIAQQPAYQTGNPYSER